MNSFIKAQFTYCPLIWMFFFQRDAMKELVKYTRGHSG